MLAVFICCFSNAQTESNLVLKKIGLSRTVEIEIDDMVKIKTADGEYYKGRLLKCDDEQLILTYDTIAINDIVKVMANTRVRWRQSSVLLASGLVAVAICGVLSCASSISTSPDEGMNWGDFIIIMGSYFYAAHAIFFGVINYYGMATTATKW